MIAHRASLEGLSVYFFSNEGTEPPHVHVDKGGATAKFWLEPVTLARSVGFGARDLSELSDKVEEQRIAFLEAWRGHFGG